MEGFQEVYTTYDPMEASLIKAKLSDEEIQFEVTGDFNIAMSMETFNTELGRMALKRPIKFFVHEKDIEIAKVAINTDKSSFFEDDMEY
ncbi:MAG TPA: DUF2007 domain-containing protein [Ignavibacteria bacterium]|nr:hypothetical protein [Bacteroidota bacterium]HRI85043.1 DUF2007 domain-containing protein [Ignavibacteria bacterium]HRJ98747.1 DUF2007 domain-containing protein [Ignavibacteria bacterium]